MCGGVAVAQPVSATTPSFFGAVASDTEVYNALQVTYCTSDHLTACSTPLRALQRGLHRMVMCPLASSSRCRGHMILDAVAPRKPRESTECAPCIAVRIVCIVPCVLCIPNVVASPFSLLLSSLYFINVDFSCLASTRHGLLPTTNVGTSLVLSVPGEVSLGGSIVLYLVMFACAVHRMNCVLYLS